MASSSICLPRTWKVFTSFHGPDVRKMFLTHLRKQFTYNGISMFDDQGIERSHVITPALTQAIRGSRISIVLLSKNYASSSWCLDELLEIFKCKEEIGQIVMTIFYGVDPSDVADQTGDFGIAFDEMCVGKTEKERRGWSQALNDAANIAGEDFKNWDNEAEMIEKIAKDVLNKLNVTPSRDFDGIVGLEAHLGRIKSLLDLDYGGVKVVAISGHAGIGKTTIARALHSLLSYRFQLTCFVDDLRGDYGSGFDEYGLKLRLQEQFLSKVLNHDGIKIRHLGAIRENLCDQKVLIILDDVHHIKQLEALVGDISWFGPGSRVVVTTENKELLQQHGIDNTYHVCFPSREEALQILCQYAFGQSFPRHGFETMALKVVYLCGNLPLGLRVVGSLLSGKKKHEWECKIRRLETVLDRDIEEVLRLGYESLDENEQTLFLHIAVFLHYKDSDLATALMADSGHLDIQYGLEILVNKSLIYISTQRGILMHKLLRKMARQVIHRQEPWKRQIIIDTQEIRDVLQNATGTRSVRGISFDISGIDELIVSKKAFTRMSGLQFLKVYKSRDDENNIMQMPEEMEFPCRLRLLHWEAYPSKCVPPSFHLENLVELYMPNSQLKYLWEGTQPLTNLKKIDLSHSLDLEKLPDLSNATNLERLYLKNCARLVELPSSISNLHKLEDILMDDCISLEVIPAHLNLASLYRVNMDGCSRLSIFPDFSTNIVCISLLGTAVQEVPASVRHWSRVYNIDIRGRGDHADGYFPGNNGRLDLSYSDIEEITYCINDFYWLTNLYLSGCRKLASLPELPIWLAGLSAENCESLERVTCPLNAPNAELLFTNCFKLDGEARKSIIQRSFNNGLAFLPGRVMPPEFNHRARGNFLTIHASSAFFRFKACVIVLHAKSQHTRVYEEVELGYRIFDKSNLPVYNERYFSSFLRYSSGSPRILSEHLCIFHNNVYEEEELSLEVSSDLVFEFFSITKHPLNNFEILECGMHILTNEGEESSDTDRGDTSGLEKVCEGDYDWSFEFEPSRILEISEDNNNNTPNGLNSCDSRSDGASHEEEDESVEGRKKDTHCWSWFFLCFGLSNLT